MRTLLLSAVIALFSSTALAQKGAPPDKPQMVRGKQALDAYDRAIAPFVAKARASYPAAKKRYLAGLPPGYSFTVFVRLSQSADKSHKEAWEDLYVIVESIKAGKIYGRVNNRPLRLTKYYLGDRIRMAESRVMNWVVLRPDPAKKQTNLECFSTTGGRQRADSRRRQATDS